MWAVGSTYDNGRTGFYTFHCNQILQCDKKEAVECLNHANKGANGKLYKLYEINLKEVDE